MENKVSKTFMKVIVAGALFLTIFAGIFGFISVSCLVMSIINCDLLDVVGCIVTAIAGWWCWSLRREVLV